MVRKKRHKIIWEDSALDYLVEQLEYVSQMSEDAPSIIKKGILKNIQSVKANPYVFEADKFKADNDGSYRAFVVYSYRVSYHITEKSVNIIRVRHTSQDPVVY